MHVTRKIVNLDQVPLFWALYKLGINFTSELTLLPNVNAAPTSG